MDSLLPCRGVRNTAAQLLAMSLNFSSVATYCSCHNLLAGAVVIRYAEQINHSRVSAVESRDPFVYTSGVPNEF